MERQTLSYIRGLLQSRGLNPKHKLGQNFLIDLNLLELIVKSAELGPEDSVLEVGTGTGSLTSRLAEGAGNVLSVEIDFDFYNMTSHYLAAKKNITFFHGDILESKNLLRPEIMTLWDETTAAHGCTRRKLVANLPYVVATPVMANLLIADVQLDSMVVMVQWEMAERLVAQPNTKEYGALSVLMQSLTDTEIIRRLPPDAFWPRPEVDSAIVRVRCNPEKRAKVSDRVKFRAFLRDLYTQRRKILRQALSGWPQGRREKPVVDAILAKLGIDGSVRAESLDIETHLRLWQGFESENP